MDESALGFLEEELDEDDVEEGEDLLADEAEDNVGPDESDPDRDEYVEGDDAYDDEVAELNFGDSYRDDRPSPELRLYLRELGIRS